MSIGNMSTLHTREDGTRYLLDVAEFTLQEGKVNAIIELFNEVAVILSKYKDTKDRAKKPDYLRGVLKGRVDFIEKSRANEIYESLKDFPLGERAKTKLVADTIEEIDGELYKELERYNSNMAFYRRDMKKHISIEDDIVITTGRGKCSVSIREGFIDELRDSMIREIHPTEIDDNETFRKAIRLLWSLAEKGYSLTEGFSISAEGQPVFMPSVVDRLMRKDVVSNPNGRDSLISDENLLNQLRR